MKAVVLQGIGKIGMQEMDEPELKPGYAVVQIKSLSVCGSDVNAYRGRGGKVEYPIVPGHEAAGIVVDISDEDAERSGFSKGDRALINPYLNCGTCCPCSVGQPNCCETLRCLGVQTDGAMRELLLHPVTHLVRTAPSLPWEFLPLAEPLTVALNAIHRIHLKKDEHILIFGAGPIGLLAALAAKNAYGAIPILVDVIQERLAYAHKIGIDYTLNSLTDPIEQRLSKITNGRMPETVMEASGANSVIAQVVSLSSYCARIALTGWPSKDTEIATSLITRKQLNVLGARNSSGLFPEAMQLIADSVVKAPDILSKTVQFDQLPGAIADMAAHPQRHIKIGAVM